MNPLQNCRRTPLMAAALGALLALSACAGREAPAPTGETESSLPPEYRFRLTGLAPAGTEAAPALAEYGIEFRLAGQLEVGPAPNGQLHKDTLGSQDREALEAAWNAWLQAGFTSTENCATVDAGSDLAPLSLRVSILRNDREAGLIRIDGGQVCGPAAAQSLVDFSSRLAALARKHYPKTFPSECLASTDALKETYTALLSCESNEDCAHIDPQYVPIPRPEVQFVSLKSCSVLPRLVSANAALVTGARRTLLAARDTALRACESESREQACTTDADPGFQNHRHPARCVARKCVAGKTPR